MELILTREILDFVGYDRGAKIETIEFVPTSRGLGYAVMVDEQNRDYVLGNPNRATRPTKYNEHLMGFEEFKSIMKNSNSLNWSLRGCTSLKNFQRAIDNKSKKYRQ